MTTHPESPGCKLGAGRHYRIEQDGYSIIDGVFSQQECEDLAIRLGQNSARGRAGIRHLMKDAVVAAIAYDKRLLEIARGATPFRATLFEKTGRSNWLVTWHQDTALPLVSQIDSLEWGPWSRKGGILYAHAPTWALNHVLALRVHLDSSMRENGPLKILPGSHRLGVLTDEEVAEFAKRNVPMECVAPQGSLLAMHPLIIHSSSKAMVDLPRRVLHIEYASSLDLGPGIRLAIA